MLVVLVARDLVHALGHDARRLRRALAFRLGVVVELARDRREADKHEQTRSAELQRADRPHCCRCWRLVSDLSEVRLDVFERSDGIDECPVRLAHVGGGQSLGRDEQQHVLGMHALRGRVQRMGLALAAASWRHTHTHTAAAVGDRRATSLPAQARLFV